MLSRAIKLVLVAVLVALGIVIPSAVSNANGVRQCASSTQLGKICINPQGGSYNATYTNTTSNTRLVDFNLQVRGGSTYGDGGAFSVVRGGSRSYVFAISQPAACVRLYLYDRTGTYAPVVTPWTC